MCFQIVNIEFGSSEQRLEVKTTIPLVREALVLLKFEEATYELKSTTIAYRLIYFPHSVWFVLLIKNMVVSSESIIVRIADIGRAIAIPWSSKSLDQPAQLHITELDSYLHVGISPRPAQY